MHLVPDVFAVRHGVPHLREACQAEGACDLREAEMPRIPLLTRTTAAITTT